VFGLKAFPLQLEGVHAANPALVGEVMRTLFPRGNVAKVIQLRRRDRTAHAISYARALLSGIWRKEQEPDDRPEPEYSPNAMARALRMIDDQEETWSAMFSDLRVEPQVLWYEDVLADPADTVRVVVEHLGVGLDPAAAVAVPAIERQSQAGARAWAEQHELSPPRA
jgi:LPS sulfotransferase NodH